MNCFELMKPLAIIILLIALYLLYRIAYPKQADTAKPNDTSPKAEKATHSIMGKSRFVLPERSQSLQTPAKEEDSGKNDGNISIFATETQGWQPAAIPAGELDKVFVKDGNSGMTNIPLDEPDIEIDDDNDDIDFEAEESEELGRIMGEEAMCAGGYDFEDLQTIAAAVREQRETVSEQTATKLAEMEHTEFLEKLAGGNDGKTAWIKTIIEHHIQAAMPEAENRETISGYGDFEVADFLS